MKKRYKAIIIFCSVFLSAMVIYVLTSKYFEHLEIVDISGDRAELSAFPMSGVLEYSDYDDFFEGGNSDKLHFTIEGGEVKKQLFSFDDEDFESFYGNKYSNYQQYEYYSSDYLVDYEFLPVFGDDYYEILETLDPNAEITGDEEKIEIAIEEVRLIAVITEKETRKVIRVDTGVKVDDDRSFPIPKTYMNFTAFVHPQKYRTYEIGINDMNLTQNLFIFTESDNIYLALSDLRFLNSSVVKIEKSAFENAEVGSVVHTYHDDKEAQIITDGVSIISGDIEGDIKNVNVAYGKDGNDKIFVASEYAGYISIDIFDQNGEKLWSDNVDYTEEDVSLFSSQVLVDDESGIVTYNYANHQFGDEVSGVIVCFPDGEIKQFGGIGNANYAVARDGKILIANAETIERNLGPILGSSWVFRIYDLESEELLYNGYLDDNVWQDSIVGLVTSGEHESQYRNGIGYGSESYWRATPLNSRYISLKPDFVTIFGN